MSREESLPRCHLLPGKAVSLSFKRSFRRAQRLHKGAGKMPWQFSICKKVSGRDEGRNHRSVGLFGALCVSRFEPF